jgi:hypothetical protein
MTRAALARLRSAADSPRARSSAARPSARLQDLGERGLQRARQHHVAQPHRFDLHAEVGRRRRDKLEQPLAEVESAPTSVPWIMT